MVPWNASVNNGAWKSLEAGWRKLLKNGHKVGVEARLVYRGTSRRPQKINFVYRVDDSVDVKASLSNPSPY